MLHTIRLDSMKSIQFNPAGDKVRMQVTAGGIPVFSQMVPIETAELVSNALAFAAEEARAGVGS